MKIPLTKPFWGKREERTVIEALRHSSGTGDGPYSKKLARALKKLTGSRFVFPVTSCTHGLELAMAAMVETGRLKAGDEVIVPSFTMTSTANCVVLQGATPVFADIEDTYYNIDPEDIKRRITRKTKGIIVVHYAGMAAAMEKILALAKKHHLFVVEDAAHAIGASQNNKMLGTFGDVGVYSFHGTKNVSCGEGGVVLTDDKKLADFMEIYRANGTNRAAFLKGIVDKYSWVGKGTSFFLSDILASIVTAQLTQLLTITNKRYQIASMYTKALFPYQSILNLPKVPPGVKPNWHIYAIRFKKVRDRDIFLKAMLKKGIDVAYHFVPLHSSKMGRRLSRAAEVANENLDPSSGFYVRNASHSSSLKSEAGLNFAGSPQPLSSVKNAHLPALLVGDLPVTDRVTATLIRLPIYPGLTAKELTYIITTAQTILAKLS